MDIDLLSKMVKDLILDNDEVSLPGVGTFVAELVPSTFSDKGYTINPPYRRLYFRQRKDTSDTALVDLYAKSNNLDYERAKQIIDDFLGEMKDVLKQKKTIIFPGLGRLRATKENNIFFVADEDLDIYPSGFGLGPISLKTHVETSEEVAAAVASLKDLVTPTASTPASEPLEESAEEPVPEPVTPKDTYESPEMNLFTPVANPAVPQPVPVTDSSTVDIPEDSAAAAEEEQSEETAEADSSAEEEEPIISEENTEEVLPNEIEPSDDVIPEEEPEEIEDEIKETDSVPEEVIPAEEYVPEDEAPTEAEEPEVSPTEEPTVDILPEIEVFPAPSDTEILPDEEKKEVSDEDEEITETDSAPEEVSQEVSPVEETSPQEETSPETPSEEESPSTIEEEEVPSSEKEDEKDIIGTPVAEDSDEDDSPEEEVPENGNDPEVAPEPVAEEPKEETPQPVAAVPEVPKPSDSKVMGDKVAALIKEKNPVISTPSVLNEPEKKKGMPVWAKVLLWTLGILLALLILYMIIGRIAPNFIDNLLYSKEDLEFLHDGVL